ncbi:phenylalanine--tRNA ligase subunit alpha [Buchnera aphidicola]|uniref:Phenylalanine--tRNA ligase alpha subunit n=1 Tax=Buchnera aphidicola (Anoecia oenotherae) TaxID=1241833 RepID=A0A4D6XUT1_9GAMM|nr:phenylalanine--tRNA ligase subunit alpha [Buchnera aphidicola]QCI19239.1 phenylalanine--tRNA ligase subunit alpha [Buchnera aphidicola (Anoecia oenotherae)]
MLKLVILIKKAIRSFKNAKTVLHLENSRIFFLGKKGEVTKYIHILLSLPLKQRKKKFIIINKSKNIMLKLIKIKKEKLNLNQMILKMKQENIDVSLPGTRINNGAFHPITESINIIKNFFFKLGFNTASGPEVEDDYHNFDALNIWKHHPSRTSQDTFWFNSKKLLRTQTSSSQIRIMKKNKPPIRTIVPGKVYRNDFDRTHSPMFHQIEGIIIEEHINFANLKWLMNEFLCFFFQKKANIKFRNSYFPFTVISAEIDIQTHNTKWLEVLGCGMIHPDILNKSGINSKKYTGCAFGLGVERITMLKYGIDDLRSFFENNLQFLQQFK